MHGASSIVPALERATHLAGQWIERSFAALGLTQAEAHALAYLAGHSSCSINDLHHSFGHKRSTLTSLLDRLEACGWVRRGPHPTSRRMVMIHLTDAGSQVADQVHSTLRALEDRILARAGSGDVGAFLRVIQTLEEELSHE